MRKLLPSFPSAEEPRARAAVVFGGFLAFFLIFFAQLPWKDAIPGNNDYFMAILCGKIVINEIAGFLGLAAAGTAMYPASVLPYGETAIGISALFTVFHLLGCSDVVAGYLNLAVLFSLSALAAYVLAGRFVTSFAARCFAGFAFTCSNMAFAHLDEPYAMFYFIPLLVLNYLVRALWEDNARHVTLAAALGGLQVYFSFYVFVYQTVLLACAVLYFHLRAPRRLPVRRIAKASLLYGAVAAPLVLFYLFAKFRFNLMTPTPPQAITMLMSLSLHDLLQALPGNLLYGPSASMPLTWDVVRHQNFIGILALAAALFALFQRGEHRVVFGGMAVVGLVLAAGPMFMRGASTAQNAGLEDYYRAFLASGIAPAPLYPFSKIVPLMSFHRVPVRAYVFVLLAVSFLAAVALDVILRRVRNRRASLLIVAFFFGGHFIENAPFPLPSYPLGPLLEIPSEYKKFMEGKRDAIVLDLPSRFGMLYPNWDPALFSNPRAFVHADPSAPPLTVLDRSSYSLSHLPLFNYSREFLYMNWQTQHKANIVGGANGYFPVSRLVYDRWLEDLPDERVLTWIYDQGVDYVVYHKHMLVPGEADMLPQLSQSPQLRVVFAGEQIVVFEFAAPRR